MAETHTLSGPPYLPNSAAVGGLPTKTTDVPICVVLLVTYLFGLLTHAYIYKSNISSPATKFRLSILVAYPCFLRLVTMILRITWAIHPQNVRLAIAAQVFTTAGVLLFYILNIIFCQRIMRAWHPKFGWRPVVSWAFPVFYALVPLTLVTVIAGFVQSLYSMDEGTKKTDLGLQRYGIIFFLVTAVFPIPFILINWLAYTSKTRPVDQTKEEEARGETERPTVKGDVRWKAVVVIAAAFVLLIGAIFRTATSFAAPRPQNDPAWYDSKACFYIFNFVTELVVVILYAVVRVDKLFFVPAPPS